MTAIAPSLLPGTHFAWQHFRSDGCPDASRLPEVLRLAPVLRQTSYLAGRECAVRALQEAGCRPSPNVGRTPQGLPDWPPHMTGSITHTLVPQHDEPSGLAIALVGARQDFRSLAIDLEPVMAAAQSDQVKAILVSANEAQLGSRLGIAAPLWTIRIYGLKEALFKMLFCEAGVPKPFDAAEVLSFDPGTGQACLILREDWGQLRAGKRFWLHSGMFQGCVLSVGGWSANAG